MKKYLAALCALCVLSLGGIALAETEIVLSDDGITAGDGVQIEDSTATITAGGVYRLRGTMEEGNLVVDAADDVEIIWDGAALACSTQAPVVARGGGNLRLTLPEGGSGTISDLRRSGTDAEYDAALFATGEVTVTGEGSLAVVGQAGHGVRAGGLRLEGGSLGILSEGDGLHVEGGLELDGGYVEATAGGYGVYVDGDATVANGDLLLDSDADGVYIEESLSITGGALEITAGGGASASASTTSYYDAFFGYDPFDFFFGGSPYDSYYGYNDTAARTYDALSAAQISVQGGSLVLDASGDGLRADGGIRISDGALSIACGSDGLRAGETLDISGGTLWVDESNVGLAGADVSLANAEITLVSADAGISAVSERGGEAAVRAGAMLAITSSGDGIQAGADVRLEGGETRITCSSRSGAPLNAGGEVFMDGGTLVSSGMANAAEVAGDSAQPMLLARFNATLRSGVQVVVEDANGESVFSFSPEQNFSMLQLSSPALAQGETYTIYVEGEALGAATVDGAVSSFSGDFINEDAPDRSQDEAPAETPQQDGLERI